MATYMVTGAAGFIANKVCAILMEQGHSVVGLDNMNNSYDVRLKYWRLARLQQHPNFRFYQQDVFDRPGLAAIFEAHPGIQGVINLAARAGVRASVENPWAFIETNMIGTLNLLEACRQHQIGKFILASTSSIYGNDAPQPTPETASSDFPLQPYSASKKGAEALCYTYHYLNDIDVTVVRYFTVYGPAGRPDMVMFRFLKWIAEGEPVRLNGDGEQSRGFTYLDDIARGTVAALRPLGYEIINLGGHEVITINDMIRILEEKLGKQAKIVKYPAHKADMYSNWGDVVKAGRLLDWKPQVGLQEGIGRMVEWYLHEREWASQVLTP
ncbi:MAG TPA: NAD-dependent epimerase/dehydratase family protein [Levilinea sp.]|nr:NAD-dependent epimerase/dehydratase family protein [Levilinea sp.]